MWFSLVKSNSELYLTIYIVCLMYLKNTLVSQNSPIHFLEGRFPDLVLRALLKIILVVKCDIYLKSLKHRCRGEFLITKLTSSLSPINIYTQLSSGSCLHDIHFFTLCLFFHCQWCEIQKPIVCLGRDILMFSRPLNAQKIHWGGEPLDPCGMSFPSSSSLCLPKAILATYSSSDLISIICSIYWTRVMLCRI